MPRLTLGEQGLVESVFRSVKAEPRTHEKRVAHEGQPDASSAGNEIVHVEEVPAERRQVLDRCLGGDRQAAPGDKETVGDARCPRPRPNEDRKRKAQPDDKVGRRVQQPPEQRGVPEGGPQNLLRERQEKRRRERQRSRNPVPIWRSDWCAHGYVSWRQSMPSPGRWRRPTSRAVSHFRGATRSWIGERGHGADKARTLRGPCFRLLDQSSCPRCVRDVPAKCPRSPKL